MTEILIRSDGLAAVEAGQGDPTLILWTDDDIEVRRFDPRTDRRLFSHAPVRIQQREIDLRHQLFDRRAASACFNLLLAAFDQGLDRELRAEILDTLEVEHSESDLDNCRSILLGSVFPDPAALRQTRELAEELHLASVSGILASVEASQGSVALLNRLWTLPSIDDSTDLVDIGEAHRLLLQLKSEGSFGRIALAVAEGRPIEPAVVAALLSIPEVSLRTYLLAAIAPVRQAARSANKAEGELGVGSKRRRKRSRKLGGRPPYEQVQAQKAGIRRAIDDRDWTRADTFVRELVEFQLETSTAFNLGRSLCDLSNYARANGSHALALNLAEMATEYSPDDPWGWQAYGALLIGFRRYPEALEAMLRSEALAPPSGDVAPMAFGKAGIAYCRRMLGDLTGSLAAASEAVALDPTSLLAVMGLAETLRALDRHQEAVPVYEAVIRLDIDAPHAYSGLALSLFESGATDEAIAVLERAVERSPEVSLCNVLADLRARVGDYGGAFDAYEIGRSVNPDDLYMRNGRAGLLRTLGRFDEALSDYDASLAIARRQLRESTRSLDLDPMLAVAGSAVTAEQQYVVTANARAATLGQLGRLDEALASYDDVLEMFPDDLPTITGRAHILRLLRRLPAALAAYEHVIGMDPNSSFAANGKAETLKAMGRLQAALEAYDYALRASPSNIVTMNGRAALLRVMGRREEAEEILSRLIQDDPHNPYIVMGMMLLLIELDEPERALRLGAGQRFVGEHFWRLEHVRGMALARSGQLEAAERAFVVGSSRATPLQVDAFVRSLAQVQLRKGRYRDALVALSSVRVPDGATQVLKLHARGGLGERVDLAEVVPFRQELSMTRGIVEELELLFVERAQNGDGEISLLEKEELLLLAAA